MKQKSYWDYDIGADVIFPSQVTVHEEDDSYHTGILRPNGEPIYRSHKQPIGFDLTPKPRVRVKALTRPFKS